MLQADDTFDINTVCAGTLVLTAYRLPLSRWCATPLSAGWKSG